MGNEVKVFDGVFTYTQQSLLKLLFGHPEREFVLKELIDHAGMGRGTVQRTLAKMTDTGLVVVNIQGNQKLYQANRKVSLFKDLVNIARQMLNGDSGSDLPEHKQDNLNVEHHLEAPRTALLELVKKFHISRVSVFGSAAHGDLQPNSQIDLLVEFRTGKAPSMVGMKIVQNAFSNLFGGRRVNLA
ncbi:MAG: hypothetical protein EP297_10730, partial [Gammaproteobacteria bacterium]